MIAREHAECHSVAQIDPVCSQRRDEALFVLSDRVTVMHPVMVLDDASHSDCDVCRRHPTAS